MTSPAMPAYIEAGRRFDTLLEVTDLSTFIIRRPQDLARIDDEFTCELCETALCDIEDDDSLETLIRVAIAHAACCPHP